MNEPIANPHPMADSHPKPFERSRVAGAELYLILFAVLGVVAVALAYFIWKP